MDRAVEGGVSGDSGSSSVRDLAAVRAPRALLVSAPGGHEARSARAAARPGSPRPVTTGGKSEQSAIVDWLNLTFEHDRGVEDVLCDLSGLLGGRYVYPEPMSGGRYGFAHGCRLLAYAGGQLVPFGVFCWGGETQRGKALLSIEGGGCRLFDDWAEVEKWVEGLPCVRLTRVDLAVDLHQGEYSVDDCLDWVTEGLFNNGGRPAVTNCQGDWVQGEHGRTLYVGKAANGKMLRCYEKGKQLGDLESPWVRFEVQFGNKDRELPLRMLTERDVFFAAAYPALREVLGIVGEKIKTVRETTRTTLAHAIEHLTRSYGKWVHLLTQQGVESADLVEAIRVRAMPPRLNLASLADAGLSATVHAVISERKFG